MEISAIIPFCGAIIVIAGGLAFCCGAGVGLRFSGGRRSRRTDLLVVVRHAP